MSMRPALAVIAGAMMLIVLLVASGRAQELAPPGGFLRVQWTVPPLPPSRAKLEGYVYNESHFRVTAVRLHVVSLDGAAHAVGETWGWVFGDVPAEGRAYFAVPLETVAATYDVIVVSYDPVSDEAQ